MGKYDSKAKPQYDDRPIPIGMYKVTIKDVTPDKISQNTGKTYCSISLSINDGEYKGRYIFDNFMYDDTWIWKWVTLFNALGVKIEDGAEINEITAIDIAAQITGLVLTIVTKNETKDGITRPKVYKYLPKGGPAVGLNAETVKPVDDFR